MKEFNITGTCVPHLHYMVDISDKLKKIIKLVETGKYFVISRPRQFGKTTVLSFLYRELSKRNDYLVLSLSFEGLGEEAFKDPETLSEAFLQQIIKSLKRDKVDPITTYINDYPKIKKLNELSLFISDLVMKTERKVVLFIDEVDRASNYNLFINFLGMLRSKYLNRADGTDHTFHSVVLAGLHDIKNIKLKIRPDSESQYNSPWNIATEFDVDMSFNPDEIATMLVDYEQSTLKIKLDTSLLSKEIYKYTNGYPFLVSKICKVIEEKLDRNWTIEGIQKAVTITLEKSNTLFDDIIKNIENRKDLYELLYAILIQGARIDYNFSNPIIQIAEIYGITKKDEQNKLVINNIIFEIFLYNYLVSKLETSNLSLGNYNFRDNFIDSNGDLEIEKVLLKFQQFIKENYSEKDFDFYEKHGRLLLIAFIKPIINGDGFYYVEAQTSYERRTDMVVIYNKKEYVLEFKVWYGEEYHTKGLKQLAGYLKSRGLNIGYLVIFNFNKNKEFTSDWKHIDDKNIFEVFV